MNDEVLKLENQLCFPLYACSKEVVKLYRPFLDKLGITYTQYIALMVLWQDGDVSVKELGDRLYLDSGTLTPLLKKLEQQGLVSRKRSEEDERVVMISVTEQGKALKEQAKEIPMQLGKCIPLEPQEAMQLHQLLHKLLNQMKAE